MLDEDVPLYQAEFVFYIRFRDVDYEKNLDLLEFLTTSAPFVSTIAPEERKNIVQYLEDCDNVCIMMDGLDEANLNLRTKQDKCYVTSRATPETFILNLLSGHLLPKAKKLITSRPRKRLDLPDECSSCLYLDLLGLNDEGQRQICSDLCRDDPVRRNKILDHINSRPDLKSLCYVPITCILIMVSFYNTDSSKSNMVTLTAILSMHWKSGF